MENGSKAIRLRIFVGSTDKHKGDVVHEKIVLSAKKAGLAGATVLKGILGFGASSILHSYKFWEVTEKVPVAIEIVDDEKKVLDFFESIRPMLEEMRYGCLATTETVDVLLYKGGKLKVF